MAHATILAILVVIDSPFVIATMPFFVGGIHRVLLVEHFLFTR